MLTVVTGTSDVLPFGKYRCNDKDGQHGDHSHVDCHTSITQPGDLPIIGIEGFPSGTTLVHTVQKRFLFRSTCVWQDDADLVAEESGK